MVNPRLAGRYAKSLVDLALEKGELETIKQDVDYLLACVHSSKELKALLRSPIIKGDKKQRILDAVTQGKVGSITAAFNKLLVSKGRENVLPEILEAFVAQYNEIKGIRQVKLITATPLSEELRNQIVAKVAQEAGMKEVALTAEVNEELIGGFVLEYDNKRIDTSIQSELRGIRQQFLRNDYMYNIR